MKVGSERVTVLAMRIKEEGCEPRDAASGTGKSRKTENQRPAHILTQSLGLLTSY